MVQRASVLWLEWRAWPMAARFAGVGRGPSVDATSRRVSTNRPDVLNEGGAVRAEVSMVGRITRLLDSQQLGVVVGDDGHDYTFHAHAVSQGTFRDLALGVAVSFEPLKGPKGDRRASAVRPVTT
jgi:cold shock CspA family protein